MRSKNWKKVEYKVARMLGGKRVPVSGRARHYKGDVDHEKYFIEVKSGKQVPKKVLKWYGELKKSKIVKTYGFLIIPEEAIPKVILRWYEKTEKECPEGKIPLLVMKPKYSHYEFVLWRVCGSYRFTTLDIFVDRMG